MIDDEAELASLDSTRIFHVYSRAIRLSLLGLRTLDTLHLAYASWLASRKLVRRFLTLDKEIDKRREAIREEVGIEVENGG